MKSFFALLFSDWRRKLVAIAIALALWTWIEGRIAHDAEVVLRVAFTTEDIGTPDDFQLLIQSPPGWVLTEPAVGDPITVWIHGSKSQVQSFKTKQCAANFLATFMPDEEKNLVTVDVVPEQLDWMRPGDAKLLLDNISEGKQELKQLVFERVKTATIGLTPREVLVDDQSSEAHEAKSGDLRFTPNTITLTGPQAALDSLLAEVDASYSATGEQNNSQLLTMLKIPKGRRDDVSQELGLNDRWKNKGIRMEPEFVLVDVMVRLKAPGSIPFTPSIDDLQIIYPTDPAAADDWELGVWEPGTWSVSLPDVEDKSFLTLSWVQEHVKLFVPLHNLDSGSDLPSQKVRIEAHIVGFQDPDEQSFFEQHVVIAPPEGSDNDMITVKEKQ